MRDDDDDGGGVAIYIYSRVYCLSDPRDLGFRR